MIVCVGLATRDTILAVPHSPEPDGHVFATTRVSAGGGPAATAAVAIGRLGVPVRFVGVVDHELEDVDETVPVPGRMPESTILVAPDGSRTIVAEEPPRLELPDGALAGADWVHVDHVGYRAIGGRCEAKLSVDGGHPIPELDLGAVDLYAPPQERDDGSRAKLTVVTRGADGCVAYTADGTIDVPGHPVDAVSTLGAGDVFHGALLASLQRGLGLRAALVHANACAALSCRALDGRSAIPTWDELEAALA
ncbi:MAG TPA: PfkB family carbohydrate kinase [Gaiellaceae bacterium]|nr:PfkB family carbohydrate kinase [Gaiellaceae bacterium]